MCDVLLLDDDQPMRAAMAELLSAEGLRIQEVSSVSEAQDILQNLQECRLLVADHDLGNLQDLDGFAFAIRAMRILPGLRVIYVSGHDEVIASRALTPRERALPKPFSAHDLLDLTREMLRN